MDVEVVVGVGEFLRAVVFDLWENEGGEGGGGAGGGGGVFGEDGRVMGYACTGDTGLLAWCPYGCGTGQCGGRGCRATRRGQRQPGLWVLLIRAQVVV